MLRRSSADSRMLHRASSLRRFVAERRFEVKVHKPDEIENDAIRIICYEDVDAWILGKFARRLDEELKTVGRSSSIGKVGDAASAVGHHIIYIDAHEKRSPIETIMVTHLDEAWKERRLAKMMAVFDMAICMSHETALQVQAIGVDPRKITYVSPAHDGLIKPRRRVIGIAGKTHADGRRDPQFIVDMVRGVDPADVEVSIMGSGWESQVETLRNMGFAVVYTPEFRFDDYVENFMPSLDYFVHYSWDEGSMAFLDAIAADARTLVNEQGFHLDVPNGIDSPIVSAEDVATVLRRDADERRRRTERVAGLTWHEYALRHRVIWDYLVSEWHGARSGVRSCGGMRDCSERLASEDEFSTYLDSDKLETEWTQAEVAQLARLSLIRYPSNTRFRRVIGELYGM
jgi:hypothetical protein